MTGGYRHDTINEHIGDWNWRKLIGQGEALNCEDLKT